MPLVDPTPRRVSACPVHFLWDGKGRGRTFVRSGFLGLLAAGAIGYGGAWAHVPALVVVGQVVAGCAIAAWLVGQAMTARVR